MLSGITCKFNFLLLWSKGIHFEKFKSGGLHEKNVAATYNLGKLLSFCSKTKKKKTWTYLFLSSFLLASADLRKDTHRRPELYSQLFSIYITVATIEVTNKYSVLRCYSEYSVLQCYLWSYYYRFSFNLYKYQRNLILYWGLLIL